MKGSEVTHLVLFSWLETTRSSEGEAASKAGPPFCQASASSPIDNLIQGTCARHLAHACLSGEGGGESSPFGDQPDLLSICVICTAYDVCGLLDQAYRCQKRRRLILECSANGQKEDSSPFVSPVGGKVQLRKVSTASCS